MHPREPSAITPQTSPYAEQSASVAQDLVQTISRPWKEDSPMISVQISPGAHGYPPAQPDPTLPFDGEPSLPDEPSLLEQLARKIPHKQSTQAAALTHLTRRILHLASIRRDMSIRATKAGTGIL
jgi:hypothetical protein